MDINQNLFYKKEGIILKILLEEQGVQIFNQNL